MGHQEAIRSVSCHVTWGNLEQKTAVPGAHLDSGSLLGDAEDENRADEGLEDCCQLRKGLQQNSNCASGCNKT